MKPFPLSTLAVFASLRFKLSSSASHAVGDKSAYRAGQPYQSFAKHLRVLRASAFRFIILLFTLPAAAFTTFTDTWSVSTVIPDNDEVGFSDTRSLNLPGITEIESVTVNLNFTGGWNGDLYAYLVHDSGYSVLLNRVGRSLANPDGSATVGMSITIADSAAMDIHTAIPMSGGTVTGTWQPDGRIIDPLVVLDTDSRPAMLSSFTGLDASGSWTLFVADQSAGDQSTLESWSLTITGVPEPSSALLLITSSLLLARRRR